LVGDVGVWLEDALGPLFISRDFGGGINQFVATLVAVDSDEAENERFSIDHDKGGRYKDFRTGGPVKFIGVAVRVNPKNLTALSFEQAKSLLAKALLDRLSQPLHCVPSGFRLCEFLREIVQSIDRLSASSK